MVLRGSGLVVSLSRQFLPRVLHQHASILRVHLLRIPIITFQVASSFSESIIYHVVVLDDDYLSECWYASLSGTC